MRKIAQVWFNHRRLWFNLNDAFSGEWCCPCFICSTTMPLCKKINEYTLICFTLNSYLVICFLHNLDVLIFLDVFTKLQSTSELVSGEWHKQEIFSSMVRHSLSLTIWLPSCFNLAKRDYTCKWSHLWYIYIRRVTNRAEHYLGRNALASSWFLFWH